MRQKISCLKGHIVTCSVDPITHPQLWGQL